jgi:ketosteroid isomerase-like protein
LKKKGNHPEENMRMSRRKFGWAGASALCLATLGLGTKLAAQSSDEAALGQAVEAFRKAMLAADGAQFTVLCADEMSYGHSAGRLETKAELITDARSGRLVWKFINLSDQTIKIVGNNGIVRHILTGETQSEGKTNAVKIGILMVWQKQGDNWKLLARQAYRI